MLSHITCLFVLGVVVVSGQIDSMETQMLAMCAQLDSCIDDGMSHSQVLPLSLRPVNQCHVREIDNQF